MIPESFVYHNTLLRAYCNKNHKIPFLQKYAFHLSILHIISFVQKNNSIKWILFYYYLQFKHIKTNFYFLTYFQINCLSKFRCHLRLGAREVLKYWTPYLAIPCLVNKLRHFSFYFIFLNLTLALGYTIRESITANVCYHN